MNERLKVEENAFLNGFYMPNQARPDLLSPPTSQSAALCFGCLSVRKYVIFVSRISKCVYQFWKLSIALRIISFSSQILLGSTRHLQANLFQPFSVKPAYNCAVDMARILLYNVSEESFLWRNGT